LKNKRSWRKSFGKRKETGRSAPAYHVGESIELKEMALPPPSPVANNKKEIESSSLLG